MKAGLLKRGDVVRAPWREFGDDVNLTGRVVSNTQRGVRVVWNADGDVTPEGDESTFARDQEIEVIK